MPTPRPLSDARRVVRHVGADGEAGAREDGPEDAEGDGEDHRHDESHDEAGEDQPADVPAPQVPRSGEHVADRHVLLPCRVVDAHPVRRPAACRRHHVCSRPQAATLAAGMRDCTRREFLKIAGLAAAGASLAAAGCGSQPAADPPQEGRLASPLPSAAGGKRARPVLSVARGGEPRRHHRRRGRRARRHGGVRQARRRRHRQAQHLHRLPRSGVRRDHQSRGRRRLWSPCAVAPRPVACASWTCRSEARQKRRTA